jgi:ceramide synthetase
MILFIFYSYILYIQQAEIENIVYKTGRPVDEVNSYLMTRKLDRIRKSKVTKFGEAFWRFLFYSYFTFLGIQILLYPKTAEWIIDTQNHFINWPFQRIPDIIVFYHQVQLGCYIHQLMWTEVSRSDSLEMIIHHLTTITLVLISHVTMFHRVGSLTFFLHDISDVFLESAKCFNYASKAKGHELFSIISNILFGIFAISFLVLRLILYPKLVVYSVVVESRDILGVWPGYYLISTLLSILVCLHIFWFSLICNMIYRMSSGGLEKDVRSEEEEEEEEQIQQQSELKKKNN